MLQSPTNIAWFRERNLRCGPDESEGRGLTSEEAIYLLVTFAAHPERLSADQLEALATILYGNTESLTPN